ncbi:MAG: hypothetical protein ACRDBP_13365, partial [Luteolibacter sp.]
RDDRSNDFPLWIRQTAWIVRHAEFLPDLGTKVQPNICLKLFFRQALSIFTLMENWIGSGDAGSNPESHPKARYPVLDDPQR